MVKKRRITLIIALGLLTAIVSTFVFSGLKKSAYANSTLDANAKSAYLADFNTGTVVYEKNSDDRLQIASMVKVMTLNLIYDEIEKGNLTYDTDISVSQFATSMGGSQAFLDANNSYKAGELIKSIIVASANDSCVAMAEHIGGSTETFVAKMNDKASELSMDNTYFVNCTGLPAPNQYSCAKDVYKMSKELFSHNGFFDFSKVWMYEMQHNSGRVTELTNTNKLSRFYEGCDGGKTGFTSEALSCLSATAKRGDTRFVCVVVGAPNSKTRNAEVSKLLNHGFANYETKNVMKKGDIISENIAVQNGKKQTINGIAAKDITLFSKKGEQKDITTETDLSQITAPLNEGAVIGKVTVYNDGEVAAECDILSSESVDKLGFFDILSKLNQKW